MRIFLSLPLACASFFLTSYLASAQKYVSKPNTKPNTEEYRPLTAKVRSPFDGGAIINQGSLSKYVSATNRMLFTSPLPQKPFQNGYLPANMPMPGKPLSFFRTGSR